MGKTRLEAFSDAVIAIIMTIMVLELKTPDGAEFAALKPLLPVFLSYILSFIFIGIYWSNHHHMLSAVECVNGKTLWANLHLLFWLSLIPFVTAGIGEHGLSPTQVSLYGVVMLFSGVAYYILTHVLIATHDLNSKLAKAVGNDRKGKISVVLYLLAVPLAFVSSWIAYSIYIGVAVMWLVPDRRIEKILTE